MKNVLLLFLCAWLSGCSKTTNNSSDALNSPLGITCNKTSEKPKVYDQSEAISSNNQISLFVTHATTKFDPLQSAKVGIDLAVKRIKALKGDVYYLIDPSTTPENILHCRQSSPSFYFFEDLAPTYYVANSLSGGITLNISSNRILLAGGYLFDCAGITFSQVILSQLRHKSLSIFVDQLIDATYMKCNEFQNTQIMTLQECLSDWTKESFSQAAYNYAKIVYRMSYQTDVEIRDMAALEKDFTFSIVDKNLNLLGSFGRGSRTVTIRFLRSNEIE